ncbi:MAG TPA: APC family permease [Chloroflexota bacterium]|nr:APC family permease [Chloroflexota bacterium]
MAAEAQLVPRDETLARNQVSLLGAIMAGSVQVAPAFNVMFTVGLIAGTVGAAVPLVMVLAGLGVLATGNSFSQFSRLWPSAGSFVTFISRSVGPRAALVVAVTAILGYIIAFSGVYVFVANYILTELFGSPHVSGLLQLVTILYGILVVVPVILGVRVGLRLAIALYVFEIVILAIFVVAVLVQGGIHGLSGTPFTTGGLGLKTVALGFALAFFAYGGFEAPAPLAEETQNPRRNVPVAVLTAIVISGIVYVLSAYALVEAFSTPAKLASDSAPVVTAAHKFVPFVAPIAVWLLLTSVTSSFLAANTETARVVFNAGREGLLPHGVARVQERFRTPWVAVIAFVAPSVIIGLISTAFTDPITASGFLGTYGSLGFIFMYLATNLALVVNWFRERNRGESHNPVTWILVPLIGALVLLIPFWGDFQPGQQSPYNLLPWLFAGLIALGIVYMLFVQVARPSLLARAGTIIMGEDAGTPDEEPEVVPNPVEATQTFPPAAP